MSETDLSSSTFNIDELRGSAIQRSSGQSSYGIAGSRATAAEGHLQNKYYIMMSIWWRIGNLSYWNGFSISAISSSSSSSSCHSEWLLATAGPFRNEFYISIADFFATHPSPDFMVQLFKRHSEYYVYRKRRFKRSASRSWRRYLQVKWLQIENIICELKG